MSQQPPPETGTGFVLEIILLLEQKPTQDAKVRGGFTRRLQRNSTELSGEKHSSCVAVPPPWRCKHPLLCLLILMHSIPLWLTEQQVQSPNLYDLSTYLSSVN